VRIFAEVAHPVMCVFGCIDASAAKLIELIKVRQLDFELNKTPVRTRVIDAFGEPTGRLTSVRGTRSPGSRGRAFYFQATSKGGSPRA
jgi:hypothetical protein